MARKRQQRFPLPHNDMIERVALAIERTMFAPHELPLDQELHGKYRDTARAAIAAMYEAGPPLFAAVSAVGGGGGHHLSGKSTLILEPGQTISMRIGSAGTGAGLPPPDEPTSVESS